MTASRLFPALSSSPTILPRPHVIAELQLAEARSCASPPAREVDECGGRRAAVVPDYLEAKQHGGRPAGNGSSACRAVAALRTPMQHAAE